MQIRTVNDNGKPFDVPLERLDEKVFFTCKLNNWEGGPGVTSKEMLTKTKSWFSLQAELCADFDPS